MEKQNRVLRDAMVSRIKSKIEQNTFRPEGLSGDLRTEIEIYLLPTGEVLSTTIVRSSGNGAYDNAVQRGIYNSAPLPMPTDPVLLREFLTLRLPFTSPGKGKTQSAGDRRTSADD